MAAADAEHRRPAVIVDDLHVTYKVWGASNAKAPSGIRARAKRALGGGRGEGSMRTVDAVRGITFTAYHGEAIALIGRNGSGKSTTLRAVAGLIPATKGAVYLDGEASLLGVNAALMNGLTGERNIQLGLLALGLTPEEAEIRKPGIIEFSGIGDFVNLPMRAYSSGMAARLRFAIATATTRDILMIDEALSTGDADFKERSQERIMELRDEAAVVFLVSHSLSTVRETCTRALWIDKGRLIMDGEANEVADAYWAAVKAARKAAAS
jgi:teichoic acid transport system ATP-binding protein